MGGSPAEEEPPIAPSGRQDLNLRPLDPRRDLRHHHGEGEHLTAITQESHHSALSLGTVDSR